MKTQEAFETPKTMHSLDNPIWNSLSTLHAHFAQGDELAKRYAPEVTLLAAMAEPTSDAYASLAKALQRAAAVLFLSQPPQIPAGWITVHAAPLVQMLCEKPNLAQDGYPAEKLTAADVPEMLALAEVTKPGPFGTRTRELGEYLGIRQSKRLVAMAGERLDLPGYMAGRAVRSQPA